MALTAILDTIVREKKLFPWTMSLALLLGCEQGYENTNKPAESKPLESKLENKPVEKEYAEKSQYRQPSYELESKLKKESKGSEVFTSPEGRYTVPLQIGGEDGWTFIFRPSDLINGKGEFEIPKKGVDEFIKKEDSGSAMLIHVEWNTIRGDTEGILSSEKKKMRELVAHEVINTYLEEKKMYEKENPERRIEIEREEEIEIGGEKALRWRVKYFNGFETTYRTHAVVIVGTRQYGLLFFHENGFHNPNRVIDSFFNNVRFHQ